MQTDGALHRVWPWARFALWALALGTAAVWILADRPVSLRGWIIGTVVWAAFGVGIVLLDRAARRATASDPPPPVTPKRARDAQPRR